MCGRYQQGSTSQPAIRERFEASEGPDTKTGLGRANVAPTQDVLTIVTDDDGQRAVRVLRWGLLPMWAKLKGGPTLINARDDKLTTSNAWKRYLGAHHRCLVPVTAWIEWLRSEDKKTKPQPFLHQVEGEELFAFAGLWTNETPKDGDERVGSVTIITCAASDPAITRVHDRQPVVLDGTTAETAWLSQDLARDDVLELVRPLEAGRTVVTPADPKLNSARNEGSELLAAPAG